MYTIRIFAAFVLGTGFGIGGLWIYQHVPTTYEGIAQVVDGDNIRVDGNNIRLVAINAPELPKGCRVYRSRPPCTERAADALHALVGGKHVFCLEVGRDRFLRPLGMCYFGDIELNMWLVKKCLVNSPRNPHHRQARYEQAIASRTCATINLVK